MLPLLFACLAPPADTPDSGWSDTGSTDAADNGTALSDPWTAPADDALFVGIAVPDTLACGETVMAEVTVENAGWADWSGAVQLGETGDAVRAALPDDVPVAPGESWTFWIPLTAPEAPGTHTTSWQMVRDNSGWFGETAQHTVAVDCG